MHFLFPLDYLHELQEFSPRKTGPTPAARAPLPVAMHHRRPLYNAHIHVKTKTTELRNATSFFAVHGPQHAKASQTCKITLRLDTSFWANSEETDTQCIKTSSNNHQA